jgi:hypothetical protein
MKIVIVGGGTAGWITATMWKKYTTDVDVTVIESPNIPIIGAGEGSTGTLPYLIRDKWPDNSINEIDFLRKTKGTIKLGIRLENWKGDGGYFYSPFHGSPTYTAPMDYAMLGAILKYGRADYSSLHTWMMEDGLTTFQKNGSRISQMFQNHSYHFDGVEVGKFFKEWCLKRGVKHISADVVDLNFDEREYLDSVKLSDGQTIESNYWFDCSGFNRVLMGKTKNKWISYKDNLPTNTAIPFSTDISSKSVKFETLAKALNSGWMWKIPLHHRHGCGYVYCDAFQNEDESVGELEKTLGYKVEPIKTIKFEPGRYEKIWYNNIIAVGLSSHFLEPLQATSIHISIISVAQLMFDHMKGYITYEHVDNRLYNKAIGVVIDDYKDFLQMHYLAGREDTPFWKFITNELKITDRNQEFINISKFRTLGLSDIQNTVGSAGFPLWCHILDNSGLYSKENIKWELEHFGQMERAYKEIDDLKRNYDSIKSKLVSNEEFFKYLKI